ncbi:MAG: GNAT family N-acetyltransferase [Anaerolineales bacterium]|nr:GNAT family N-acetyltransferase [Anaerolineales bacterium]
MLLTSKDFEIEVRAGTVADVPLLLQFIHQMAAFEKLPVTATEDSLRAVLFGEAPAARVLLAFSGAEPVAYVTYFFTFATMVGRRGLWLDDVFVVPAFRSQGVGRALMAYLAQIAVENQCARFEWIVLDWNQLALDFYEGLGAKVLSEWRICRLEEAQLPHLANHLRQKR